METAERFEFKFVLGQDQSEAFLRAFGSCLRPDTQGGPSGVYPVVSLYYDTPDMDCYWEAWRRLPSRRKLRVRVYGSKDGTISPSAFLEIKCKIDGKGVKHRFQTDLSNALGLASGQASATPVPREAVQVVEQVRRMVHIERFEPRCVVRYRRTAFAMTSLPDERAPLEEPLRITFDDAVQHRFELLVPEPDDSRFSTSLLAEGQRILEIKGHGAMPYSLSTFLGRQQIQPTSFSKYCHALGSLPEIAATLS